MDECGAGDPNDRPDFQTIITRVRRLIDIHMHTQSAQSPMHMPYHVSDPGKGPRCLSCLLRFNRGTPVFPHHSQDLFMWAHAPQLRHLHACGGTLRKLCLRVFLTCVRVCMRLYGCGCECVHACVRACIRAAENIKTVIPSDGFVLRSSCYNGHLDLWHDIRIRPSVLSHVTAKSRHSYSLESVSHT